MSPAAPRPAPRRALLFRMQVVVRPRMPRERQASRSDVYSVVVVGVLDGLLDDLVVHRRRAAPEALRVHVRHTSPQPAWWRRASSREWDRTPASCPRERPRVTGDRSCVTGSVHWPVLGGHEGPSQGAVADAADAQCRGAEQCRWPVGGQPPLLAIHQPAVHQWPRQSATLAPSRSAAFLDGRCARLPLRVYATNATCRAVRWRR